MYSIHHHVPPVRTVSPLEGEHRLNNKMHDNITIVDFEAFMKALIPEFQMDTTETPYPTPCPFNLNKCSNKKEMWVGYVSLNFSTGLKCTDRPDYSLNR